jgi:hypothetical protein
MTEKSAEENLSFHLDMLRSGSSIERTAGGVFLEQYARKYFFGYPPQNQNESLLIDLVSDKRYEITNALKESTDKRQNLRYLQVAGLLGLLNLNDSISQLANCEDLDVVISLIEGLTGRYSHRLRAAIVDTRDKFDFSDVAWLYCSFALCLMDGRASLTDNEKSVMSNRLESSKLGLGKYAQIAFYLAGLGDPLSKHICLKRVNEHGFALRFRIETMCEYGCADSQWKLLFSRHCGSLDV